MSDFLGLAGKEVTCSNMQTCYLWRGAEQRGWEWRLGQAVLDLLCHSTPGVPSMRSSAYQFRLASLLAGNISACAHFLTLWEFLTTSWQEQVRVLLRRVESIARGIKPSRCRCMVVQVIAVQGCLSHHLHGRVAPGSLIKAHPALA